MVDETEVMLEKCYEVGCCGSILLTDTPCDRCPVLADIRLYVEHHNKSENKTKEENNEES